MQMTTAPFFALSNYKSHQISKIVSEFDGYMCNLYSGKVPMLFSKLVRRPPIDVNVSPSVANSFANLIEKLLHTN